jgi:predicted nuclease with TOPRIM domain
LESKCDKYRQTAEKQSLYLKSRENVIEELHSHIQSQDDVNQRNSQIIEQLERENGEKVLESAALERRLQSELELKCAEYEQISRELETVRSSNSQLTSELAHERVLASDFSARYSSLETHSIHSEYYRERRIEGSVISFDNRTVEMTLTISHRAIQRL